jgi:hypothetical protein
MRSARSCNIAAMSPWWILGAGCCGRGLRGSGGVTVGGGSMIGLSLAPAERWRFLIVPWDVRIDARTNRVDGIVPPKQGGSEGQERNKARQAKPCRCIKKLRLVVI